MRSLLAAALGALSMPACGAGVITSEEVSPGEGIVIGLVVVSGILFVAYEGGRGT